MKKSIRPTARRRTAGERAKGAAGMGLGLLTVAFAAGLYAPAVEAQEQEFWTPYFGGGMVVCICEDTEEICAPCLPPNG